MIWRDNLGIAYTSSGVLREGQGLVRCAVVLSLHEDCPRKRLSTCLVCEPHGLSVPLMRQSGRLATILEMTYIRTPPYTGACPLLRGEPPPEPLGFRGVRHRRASQQNRADAEVV